VGAGLAEPTIEEVSFRRQFVNQSPYWRFLIETPAATSPVLRSLQHEAQDTVRERVHEAARPFRRGIRFPERVPERCNILIRVFLGARKAGHHWKVS
jgi:hypothetical protein